MRMKKLFLLSFFALVLPVSLFAQDDDMYFVPTKKNVEKAKKDYGMPRDTYYSGSNRSVDEYNRRYADSSVTAIDSLGNVIPTEGGDDRISFDETAGVYPDSLGDYTYTRKMSRWDDYEWRDAYHAGYLDGRWGRWGWSSPYYYSGWYGGWYDPWYYDPWYYGSWGYGSWGYGWYDPWYYGWGWGYPHYWHNHWHGGWYPGGGITVARRSYGTRNHSTGSSTHSNGYNYRRYNSIGNNRGYANNGKYDNTNTTNRNMNFGGVRNSNGNTYQNNSSFGGTRNSNSSGSLSNGGGNRGGGGGSFGGGNRGGGGRFGGGRR